MNPLRLTTVCLFWSVVAFAQGSGSSSALPPLVRSARPAVPPAQGDMVHIAGRPLSEWFSGPSDERKPARYCGDFAIDRTEVTNEQFARVLNAADSNSVFHDPRMDILLVGPRRYESRLGRENFPVTFVDWNGAYAFARWAGKSLPTEAEWMVAALGTRPDSAVAGPIQLETSAVNGLNIERIPHVVAAGAASIYATSPLFDLAGNVAEWTNSEILVPAENLPPLNMMVVKGGSYLDPPENLTVAGRVLRARTERLSSVGFRCIVRDADRR